MMTPSSINALLRAKAASIDRSASLRLTMRSFGIRMMASAWVRIRFRASSAFFIIGLPSNINGKVVGYTAYTGEEEIGIFRNSGVSKILHKPASYQKVEALLKEFELV